MSQLTAEKDHASEFERQPGVVMPFTGPARTSHLHRQRSPFGLRQRSDIEHGHLLRFTPLIPAVITWKRLLVMAAASHEPVGRTYPAKDSLIVLFIPTVTRNCFR